MTKSTLGMLICLAFLSLGLACEKRAGKAQIGGIGDSGLGPSGAKVQSRRSPDLIKIHGVFVPTRRVKIKSEFSGRLDQLAVAKGQAVSRQNPLFRIEDDQLSQDLDLLRAQIRAAEAAVARLEETIPLANVEAAPEEVPEVAVLPLAQAPVEEVPLYREPTFSRLASEIQFTSPDAGGVWPGIDPRVIERSQDPQDAGGIWPSYGIRETVGGEEFFSAWNAFFVAASYPMPSRAEEFTSVQNIILTQPVEAASEPETPSTPVSPELEIRLSLYQARLDRMRAELATMENEWRSREISSPIDGRIHELAVSEGSNVEAGDLLVEIYQVDPIEFSFQIPKGQVDFLEPGMTVQGKLSDPPGIDFKGEISYIAAELDPDGETVEVRARMGNSDDAFKVGAKGSAEIDLKSEFTAQIQ